MKKQFCFILSLALSALVYFLLPDECSEAGKRAASIFVIAALFWALEVIPLYATSIVVVVLLILFLSTPINLIGADPNDYQIFLLPFSSPVIMLFFCGFVLAQAVKKHGIDKMIASKLFSLFGSKPVSILYGLMFIAAILSMWISNTATAAMMTAMVFPLLTSLDKDDQFKKGIVLAIAFGANIGGIGTPIGTPPNAIALGILRDNGYFIDFLTWMKMAIPLAFLLLLIAGLILYFMFYPKRQTVTLKIEKNITLSKHGKLVIIIGLITIVLWLTSVFHHIPESVVALMSVAALTGFKIINHADLKKIEWDILVLMWGGLALGKGIEVSGLTDWIFQLSLFEYEGVILVAVFCLLGVLMSMTMSNTATASLLLPIAISIPTGNHLFLAITVTLACSLAMALPISTPPNAIAFATESITSKDMFKSGIIVCIVSLFVILIGYEFVLGKLF